jgi:DNA-binding FrmR family transcriptional regulator
MTDPKVLSRLARVEGQVRALTGMLQEGRYCLDVVTQIRAARAGLARVEKMILAEHLAHCVEGAIASGDPDEQRKKMAELIALLDETDR